MRTPFLTCLYEPGTLKYLTGFSVVFYTRSFSILKTLKNEAHAADIHIHCVYIKSDIDLSEILFDESWKEYPIAIEAPSIGRIYKFLQKTPIIRKLNIRFYFSTKEPSSYKDIRILSSLGFLTTIFIDGERTEWDKLADLMIFSLLNVNKHAEIHPFDYLKNYYHPHNRTDFNAVYFNDPDRYLHLDKSGNLYLKRDPDLSVNELCGDLTTVDAIKDQPAYKNEKDKWYRFFLEPTRCACCKGWRICLGKYADFLSINPGCSDFFSELLDTIDLEDSIRRNKPVKMEIWQP